MKRHTRVGPYCQCSRMCSEEKHFSFFFDRRTYSSSVPYFAYLNFDVQNNTVSVILQQTTAYSRTQLPSIFATKRTTEGTWATVHRRARKRLYRSTVWCKRSMVRYTAYAPHKFTVRINVQAGIVEDEVANERCDCEGYGKEAAVERLNDLHLRAEQEGKIKMQ